MNSSSLAGEELSADCFRSLLDESAVQLPLRLVYVAVFVVCLLGNSFTLVVIVVHPLMRTATNFFLANLAVADLFVAIFCILQNMVHLVSSNHGNWPLGEFLCKMYVLVLQTIPCTSIGILICVSLEKYVAVLHPLFALKLLTHKLRVMMTASIWLLSLLMNLPFFYNAKLYSFTTLKSCSRDPSRSSAWLVTASFVLWYCVPLLILSFLYTRIGVALWRTAGGSLPGDYSDSFRSNRVVVYKKESLLQLPDETVQCRRSEMLESRRKVIRLLIAVVLSFALLTLPHHARLLYQMWGSGHVCASSPWILLQPLSYILLFVSSGVNPFLYAFLSRRFREATADILKCRRLLRHPSTRTRTLVSDCAEESRAPSPLPTAYRLHRIRAPPQRREETD